LGRCKQKQCGLRGLLCRWPSITEWEMYITAQGFRLRNDLYRVEWDVKLYYIIPYLAVLNICVKDGGRVFFLLIFVGLCLSVEIHTHINSNKILYDGADWNKERTNFCNRSRLYFSTRIYLYIFQSVDALN